MSERFEFTPDTLPQLTRALGDAERRLGEAARTVARIQRGLDGRGWGGATRASSDLGRAAQILTNTATALGTLQQEVESRIALADQLANYSGPRSNYVYAVQAHRGVNQAGERPRSLQFLPLAVPVAIGLVVVGTAIVGIYGLPHDPADDPNRVPPVRPPYDPHNPPNPFPRRPEPPDTDTNPDTLPPPPPNPNRKIPTRYNTSIGGKRASAQTLQEALQYALEPANRRRIFDMQRLSYLLSIFGNDQTKLLKAVLYNLGRLPASGPFEHGLIINGLVVVVRGTIVRGVPQISTILVP